MLTKNNTELTGDCSSGDKKVAYEVIHTTAGRMRMRILQVGCDSEYTHNLNHLVNSFKFVTHAYVNLAARSLVVNYSPKAVSPIELEQHLAQAIQKAATPSLSSLCTVELAKRLDVSFQAITWHRAQPDFAAWTIEHDLDGFAWAYDYESEQFDCCGYGDPEDFETTSKGHKILLAVEKEASQQVGGFVGKLAGQGVGMLLLGSTGVMLGGSGGAWFGEIIGLELAALMLI